VPRLVHHLGGGVELGVHVGDLLHDLGRADQRPLLAVEELRQLPRLCVAAQVRLLAVVHPVPDVRAVDADRLVGHLLGVLRIEVLRPVDARVHVPLEPLALLVEARELVAGVLVLPPEGGVEGPRDVPAALVDRIRIAVSRGHAVLLPADLPQRY
jgi:hypothetical protein